MKAQDDFYASLDTTLAERERVLLAELERVRALRAAARGGSVTVQQLKLSAPTVTLAGTTQMIRLKPAPKSLAVAARQVLVSANRPLPIRQLIQGMQQLGVGRDQSFATLRASVTPTLRRRRDWFVRVGRGIYSLADSGEKAG